MLPSLLKKFCLCFHFRFIVITAFYQLMNSKSTPSRSENASARTHARTDGRTTRKHNASGSICWMDWDIYGYVVSPGPSNLHYSSYMDLIYLGSQHDATRSRSSDAWCYRYRSISAAHAQAATSGGCRSTGHEDRGRTPDRYIDPALHTMRVV